MESEQNAKTSTCVSRESNKRKDSTPHRIPSCIHRCSIFHPHAIPLRTKSTGLACLYLVSALHWIVEEEQAMLPDPLRRKRADCTLLNPQKDTTHTSGHKRTQIDHPAPPMVPTGQQLTTYLLWNGPQYKQSAPSWLFLLLLLGLGTRRGDKKGTPPKRRSSAMSDVRELLANVSGHEL